MIFTGITTRTKTISSNLTIDGKEDVYYINCSGGARTITLPSAVGKLGKVLEFIKNETSSNNMVIAPNGSETINGMSSITLNQAYSSLKLKSDNSNWIAEWNPIMKQYTLTVTGSTWTTPKYANGIPYQTIDGKWRFQFNIGGTVTSSTRTTYVITITGITVLSGYDQSIYAMCNGYAICRGIALQSTSTMSCNHSSGSSVAYKFSGDIELNSKPTFAE